LAWPLQLRRTAGGPVAKWRQFHEFSKEIVPLSILEGLALSHRETPKLRVLPAHRETTVPRAIKLPHSEALSPRFLEAHNSEEMSARALKPVRSEAVRPKPPSVWWLVLPMMLIGAGFLAALVWVAAEFVVDKTTNWLNRRRS
jgi:hypothetical protein